MFESVIVNNIDVDKDWDKVIEDLNNDLKVEEEKEDIDDKDLS